MANIDKSILFTPSRAQFDESITIKRLRQLAKQPELRVLQCCEPVSDDVWKMINEHLLTERPDVALRVFGHYSSKCNLKFAHQIPNVRHFTADCLSSAAGIDALAELPHLESLDIGILDLTDFNILAQVPQSLTALSLGATRSKRPTLTHLSRFRSLRKLYLEEQSKGIEVLSELRALEELTLRSITTPDVQYLRDLPKLWSLDIKLGGIRNYAAIEGKPSIKYLELWQVRELRSIEFIGTLPGLQNLFLQSLPQVSALPRLSNSKALRRIVFENLKGLSDFTALHSAPALEEFALVDGAKQTAEQLLPVFTNPHVRRISASLGNAAKQNEFIHLCTKYGKAEFDRFEPFKYE